MRQTDGTTRHDFGSRRRYGRLAAVGLVLALAACGGGGGGDDEPPPAGTPAPAATISGPDGATLSLPEGALVPIFVVGMGGVTARLD